MTIKKNLKCRILGRSRSFYLYTVMTVKPEEIHNQRILLSPLNWGSGHVSRCIGLIHKLLSQDNTVVVACSEEQQQIFELYFDALVFEAHDPYPFRFGGKGHFAWDMLTRFGALRRRLARELKETEALVHKHRIDLVIADHRYGFRSTEVRSVFVTHQLNLPVRWYEGLVQRWHRGLMSRFDSIWVMDFPDHSLAGKLSENKAQLPVEYIGPYSRFMFYELPKEKTVEEVLVVSGPDVYARKFLGEMIPQISETAVIVGSEKLAGMEKRVMRGWKKQDEAIISAKKLISRSGYSTIMDLHFLGIEAELSPTPGQREQEYLFKKFHA